MRATLRTRAYTASFACRATDVGWTLGLPAPLTALATELERTQDDIGRAETITIEAEGPSGEPSRTTLRRMDEDRWRIQTKTGEPEEPNGSEAVSAKQVADRMASQLSAWAETHTQAPALTVQRLLHALAEGDGELARTVARELTHAAAATASGEVTLGHEPTTRPERQVDTDDRPEPPGQWFTVQVDRSRPEVEIGVGQLSTRPDTIVAEGIASGALHSARCHFADRNGGLVMLTLAADAVTADEPRRSIQLTLMDTTHDNGRLRHWSRTLSDRLGRAPSGTRNDTDTGDGRDRANVVWAGLTPATAAAAAGEAHDLIVAGLSGSGPTALTGPAGATSG